MNKSRRGFVSSGLSFCLLIAAMLCAVVATSKIYGQNAMNWQTYAERTGYRETPRYDETVAYCRRLDAASDLIKFESFGASGQGRALPLVIAASGGEFTPQLVKKSGKAIVLIQACIHAGEADGKDAGLALMRDIAITKSCVALLEHAVVLFIPIYNADGHEIWSAYNRLNQNGPAEMGWRATAERLNLNRDYTKADAPETRAWLRLWNAWQPDLFVDCHTTDGADFEYNITYQYEAHENVARSVRDWMKAAFDSRIVPAAERYGNLLSPYLEFRDNRDPSRGINSFIATPRFATAYVPVMRNRPALLIESHALKPNQSRVQGTYDLLRATLEEVNRAPEDLRRAVRAADSETSAQEADNGSPPSMPLRVELTDKPVTLELRGVAMRRELSDVSGAERVIFGTRRQRYSVPFYNQARVASSVIPPRYYIVPPEWASVIELLILHGVELQKLTKPFTVDVESYRFTNMKWATTPFEGRLPLTYKAEPIREQRTFPVGSAVVNMKQLNARIALHLLEPDAPDSLVAWGFFNTVFEQKEFGEDYVLEKLAREMLAKDAKLRTEFEARVESDPQFAANPRERLRFFYERSPYLDTSLNVYPVARVMSDIKTELKRR